MNLDLQNKCLLSKWLFKLSNKHGIWQDLLRNKYIKDKAVTGIEKSRRLSFLDESHECKRNFHKFRNFYVKGW
jgi:hypothetical protein